MTGAELRAMRKAAGLKAVQLARLVGVGKISVCNWEHGRRAIRPPIERLIRRVIAEVEAKARES